jgi:hypothetical protein
MTQIEHARAALKNLGVQKVDTLSDAQVQAHISTLFGTIVSFSGSLALTFKLSVEDIARLFRTFAEVLDPEDPDPVTAMVARLAETPK